MQSPASIVRSEVYHWAEARQLLQLNEIIVQGRHGLVFTMVTILQQGQLLAGVFKRPGVIIEEVYQVEAIKESMLLCCCC